VGPDEVFHGDDHFIPREGNSGTVLTEIFMIVFVLHGEGLGLQEHQHGKLLQHSYNVSLIPMGSLSSQYSLLVATRTAISSNMSISMSITASRSTSSSEGEGPTVRDNLL
jgi:hypothetical protein